MYVELCKMKYASTVSSHETRAVADERGSETMNMQAALVLSILQQWRYYEWTVQGFGFIRTKIQNVGRIHIWDSRLTIHNVSTMHTHPWPLRSTIISGELINQRFVQVDPHHNGMSYMRSRIATGEGGGLVGEPELVRIFPENDPEFYVAGCIYEQRPDEIHRSIPQDGCVTLLERPQGPPLEEAFTFWPAGLSWGSAEPKPIEQWQIEPVINYALARWAPNISGSVCNRSEQP